MSHASVSSDVLGHEMLAAKCAELTKKQQKPTGETPQFL